MPPLGPAQQTDWGQPERRRRRLPQHAPAAPNLRPLHAPLPAGKRAAYAIRVLWNPAGGTPYDALSVASVEITRGRQGESLTSEIGRCRLSVYDLDRVYDPNNASSPLGTNLKLMRTALVEMAPEGLGTHRLFTGFVSRIWHDVRNKRTTIEAVDGFELVNLVRPTIAPIGPVFSGTAVSAVLDTAGVPPSLRDLDGGDVVNGFTTDGTASGLEEIDDLLAVDRGWYYVRADGRHAYRDRSSLYGRRTAAATFTPAVGDVAVPSIDVQNITNKQTVRALPDGAPQTASDAASQLDYSTRQAADIESAYLLNDNQAASLADWVVLTRGSPDLATRTLFVPGMTAAQAQQQATREIGDPVALSDLGPATSARIAGVAHRITAENHTTEYTLSLRTSVGFTIGVSVIEGTDVFVY